MKNSLLKEKAEVSLEPSKLSKKLETLIWYGAPFYNNILLVKLFYIDIFKNLLHVGLYH